MRKLLFLLGVLLLLIVPASAYVTSYTAPDDKAIWGIDFDAPYGSTGDIVLTLEDGSTIDGSWSYTGIMPIVADMELEGEISTYSYFVAIPVPLRVGIWNGDNSSYSREIKMGYGQTGIWNDVITASILNSPTVSYSITSSQPITVTPELKDRETARKQLSAGDPFEGSMLDLLFEQIDTIMSIFFGAIYWLKFLFVDHILLTTSLYFAGSMAYAINTSRNIFTFYKTFFRQQRAMFEFIVNMSSGVISLVAQIGGLAISGAGSILGKIIHLFI